MQFKKTATIVLAATMIVTSFSFNTVSASETAEAVDYSTASGNCIT